MALLKPTLLFNVAKRAIGTSKVLGAGHWNKDWKPGDFPTTEEQMAAAAKKYGLLKEEYKPIPDDGDGAGDYPDFKPYSVEGRDIHYPWDFPEYRRNFTEPMHEDFNIYTEDRWDVERKLRYSLPVMLLWFFGVMGTVTWLTFNSHYTFFIPALPKHIPKEGAMHYKYPEK